MQTFLFTDIEGSTRLWERHPQAMGPAIARHERILRDAIDARGGAVFNTAGDSVCAVFPAANRAIAAAIAAQRRLLAEPWDTYAPELTISVRMALDAGDAETSGENFVGPVLNRLHRLMKTGHGGQILCTAAIAPDDLGPELRLRDLGRHPLRDIAEEIQLYQLVAPGLPIAFPPLITDRPLPRRLPLPPITLFGREHDLEIIDNLLRARSARLVTLLGPGGVGKTSLSLALGRQIFDAFPDGVNFVDLSALRDGALVVPAIAAVLDIDDPLLSLEDALVARLQSRSMLLMLDNCEQVVDAVAAIVRRLVSETDAVTVLATSRIPLRVRGEHEIRIEPFPVPTYAENPASNPAVQLFAEQARQVNNRFALTPATQPEVVKICRLLDGLPLAIELAAAWVRILDPATLHARLADGAPLLKSDTRDRPERHRTLTSTIDWSYQLLSSDAQWAFGRLSVFQGGIPFDGAMAVLQDGDRFSFVEALALVDSLVQANLLQAPTQTADGPRYAMLQMIQEFGISTLAAQDRIDASRAHAMYFAAMAASAQAHYRDSEAPIWLARLDANLGNLREAVEWLTSSASDTSDTALLVATQLWEYFDLRNRHTEARALLLKAHALDNRSTGPVRARALALLGHTSLTHNEQAEAHYRDSIEMAMSLPDADPPLDALVGLVILAQMRGDLERAISLARDLLKHAQDAGRPEAIAQALLTLGQILAESGETESALACWAESEVLSGMLGDDVGLAWIQRARGELEFWQGNYDAASELLIQVIQQLRPLGERQLIALCHLDLAKISAVHGDRSQARAYLADALDEVTTGGMVIGIWEAIRTGAIVLTLDQPNQALMLSDAAENWSKLTGNWGSDRRAALANQARTIAQAQVSTESAEAQGIPISLRDALLLLQKTIAQPNDSSETLAAPLFDR